MEKVIGYRIKEEVSKSGSSYFYPQALYTNRKFLWCIPLKDKWFYYYQRNMFEDNYKVNCGNLEYAQDFLAKQKQYDETEDKVIIHPYPPEDSL